LIFPTNPMALRHRPCYLFDAIRALSQLSPVHCHPVVLPLSFDLALSPSSFRRSVGTLSLFLLAVQELVRFRSYLWRFCFDLVVDSGPCCLQDQPSSFSRLLAVPSLISPFCSSAVFVTAHRLRPCVLLFIHCSCDCRCFSSLSRWSSLRLSIHVRHSPFAFVLAFRVVAAAPLLRRVALRDRSLVLNLDFTRNCFAGIPCILHCEMVV
jgi:hypothetical protein